MQSSSERFGLPGTIERLLVEVAASVEGDNAGGPVSYELAESAGALHHCDTGGEPIVDLEAMADWLLAHYEAPEALRADIEEAMRRSGLELGDPLSPNYCSYHAQISSE